MADPNTSPWLGGEKERRSGGGRGFSNKTFIEHFVDPFLYALELGWREGAVPSVRGLVTRDQLDLVVPGSVWRELIGVLWKKVVQEVPELLREPAFDVIDSHGRLSGHEFVDVGVYDLAAKTLGLSFEVLFEKMVELWWKSLASLLHCVVAFDHTSERLFGELRDL